MVALRRWKKRLLEHISFGSPRAIVLNLSAFLFVLWALPTDRTHWLPVRSVWESFFAVKPYSSGILRALSRLLHGDVEGALAYNRLVLVVFGIIVLLILWNARLWANPSRPGGRHPRAVDPAPPGSWANPRA